MAVLTSARGVRRLPGADEILAAHGPALPQPDQLCGPFAAWAALHAVVGVPPPGTDLALVADTRIWPHDVAAWRPGGARLDRTGWESLPVAAEIDDSGTDAAELATGIALLCPEVIVIPAQGPGRAGDLMMSLVDLGRPVGVVANLRTGPVAPPGLDWDVGHFVVLWGVAGDAIAVADSYAELGAPGLPPGCRLVAATRVDEAIGKRGLLVLAAASDAVEVTAAVAATGFAERLWTT